MMLKCWASVLGDCDKQSREHYISRCLWTNENLMVIVPSWNDGKPKQININSLFSRILCEHHNNALSDLDREAGKFFKAVEWIIKDVEQKRNLKRSEIWKVISHTINGDFLERWLFKLVIGIVSVLKTDSKWALTKTVSSEPPDDIVRMVFGIKPIVKPFGIYSMLENGKSPNFMEEVTFAPYMNDEEEYVGATVSLRTIPFLVWMSNIEITKRFQTLSEGFLMSDYLIERYHHQEITFTTKGKIISRLKFSWS